MGFWMLAALAAIFIVLILGYALFSPARTTARASAEFDMAVYRDQLKELDRDVARGVVSEADAERTKIEISRRLLEADKAAQAQSGAGRAPRSASIAAVAGIAVLLVGGGWYLYSDLGAPGYPDLPLDLRKSLAAEARENRPDQKAAEAEMPAWEGPAADVPQDYVELVAQLRTAVARRPGDVQGLALLAQHEAQLGNYRAAHNAQWSLIQAKGDEATANDYSDLAELLILAAGGYVSPEAETALSRALQIEPGNKVARYYSGLMFAQNDRPDLAFRMWRALLESSAPEDPWVGPIRERIELLASAAGVNYTLPDSGAAPRGPSAQDIENAAEMTEEERQDMIRGMVAGLSDRLATEGGPASDWARLIRALGVLGDMEQAQAIWAEAQARFEGQPGELDIVRAAARDAGVAE